MDTYPVFFFSQQWASAEYLEYDQFQDDNMHPEKQDMIRSGL